MKVAKRIIGGVAGLAVVAGALIGYQEVRKAEAFQVCEEIGSQPTLENIEKMENCVRSLKKIPFLGERGKEELARVEGLLPLLRTLATLNEGASEAVSETKTETVERAADPQPVVATMAATPSPAAPAPTPVSFDSLPPCDQLDAIAKAGKSVSEFLVAAARVGDFKKYETAISETCPWNAEQLIVANRVLYPPVVVVQPRVVHRAAPAPVPSPQPRIWNQGGPRIVPAEEVQEAWCYSSNPLDCPRNQNGNPWDNDLPELPRNSEKSETFEPLLHEGEF